jgi:hypothetical protein
VSLGQRLAAENAWDTRCLEEASHLLGGDLAVGDEDAFPLLLHSTPARARARGGSNYSQEYLKIGRTPAFRSAVSHQLSAISSGFNLQRRA